MRLAWKSVASFSLLTLLTDSAHAGLVGPENYDFARFGRPIAWSQGGSFVGWTPTSADIDGDRRLDLVLYAQDAQGWRSWVALSHGDGTFSTGVAWTAEDDWVGSTMLTADTNADARADLISLSPRTDVLRISIAVSKGSGTFNAPLREEIPGNYVGWASTVGDVDGDARPDLILQSVNDGSWLTRVALNRGGTFAAPVPWSASGDFRAAPADIGDFDGDGRTDVVLQRNGPDGWHSWVALSQGNGTFAAPVEWSVAGEFSGWVAARADFDADRRTDLQLWAYDGAVWKSQIARSDGRGSFQPLVTWNSEDLSGAWAFTLADFNADGAADMAAQRADGKGWEVRVAIALGDGTFIAPKHWADLEQNYAAWAPAIMDISGDGRADVIAHAADGIGWRTWGALARPCDTVISNHEDFVGRVAGLTNALNDQIVCFKPGVYEGELLISAKRGITFVAPHGDVSIESNSFAYTPDATEGQDPGAPIQVFQSESIELDGFLVKNRFVYQRTPETNKVARAIEIFQSRDITLSHSHLASAGKQTVNVARADGVTIVGTLVECYYFCVDATFSSVHAWSSHFRMNHAAIPEDDHAIFWTDDSDQNYVNCTMEFITGKGVFAGANDFNTNILEVAGETFVSPNAVGWLSQHPNYEGLNLRLSGTYPDLADWYFMGNVGRPANAQVCHAPSSGWAHCVNQALALKTVIEAACRQSSARRRFPYSLFL